MMENEDAFEDLNFLAGTILLRVSLEDRDGESVAEYRYLFTKNELRLAQASLFAIRMHKAAMELEAPLQEMLGVDETSGEV